MSSFKYFARTAGVIAGLSAMGVAHAASSVESLGGTVRVNRGAGFTVLQGSAAVKPGDTVMADPKGKGRLVYGDGCAINVKPGSVVTVAEVSPCSMNAQAPADQNNAGTAGVAGLAGPGTGLLVAAGVATAVGVGVGVGVTASSSGGGNPANSIIPFLPPKPASP